MPREKRLLILGASVRAAAFSALAGGLEPICGDAFADADLARACPTTAAGRYPPGLIEIARAAPPLPWMYTGALENHPALVAEISESRPLLGNDARVLARVRDPLVVARALSAAGLSAPDVRFSLAEIPPDGSWLRKPLRSSGGAGVVAWTDAIRARAAQKERGSSRPYYFQKRIEGDACAAIYLAVGGISLLLGATEQLLGGNGSADAFRYAGSVGPRRLTNNTADRLRRIGTALAAEFRLVGLFGVDYIDDGRDVWPVEVNPRYTASVEILERALGFSAVAWHAMACREARFPDAVPAHSLNLQAKSEALWQAKRILFASRGGVVDAAGAEALLAIADQHAPPAIADIPCPGARLLPGRPILTLFGHGDTRAAALAEIDRSTESLKDRLPI